MWGSFAFAFSISHMFSNEYMLLFGIHIVSGCRRHNSIGEFLHLGCEKHGICNKIETCRLEHKRRIKLTFFSREHRRNLVRRCAPLHYSKGHIEWDELGCYYLVRRWNFTGQVILAIIRKSIFTFAYSSLKSLNLVHEVILRVKDLW